VSATTPRTEPPVDRASEDPAYAAQLRRAVLGSSIGSALEYYDFALYGLASALVFGTVFFPSLGAAGGVVASFATYAVGFAARPVGGVVFGALGDRLGRKWVLVATVTLMGVASTLVGVLPTGKQVGAVAPILLVVLRLLQGFGAGAEQAGASTLMAEFAPVRRRGFYAALPFIGILLGTVLASGVFGLVGLAGSAALVAWLWRLPFFGSAVLIVIALILRTRLQETPAFVHLEQEQAVSPHPFREVMRVSWRTILRGIGLRMGENGGSYLLQTLAITYITAVGVPSSVGPFAVAIASVVGAAVVPFAGALSDRVGRVPVYRFGAGLQVVLAGPAWWLLSLGQPWLVIVVLSVSYGIGVNVMLGAQCALLPELFGAPHRYSGVAIAREFSAIVAGGIGPFVGSLLLAIFHGSWVPLAIYLGLLSLITFLTTFVTPETRGRDLTLPDDAVGDDGDAVRRRPPALGHAAARAA